MNDKDATEGDDKHEPAGPKILQWASIIGVAATFVTSLVAALLTHQTQAIVNQSQHAEEFAKAFAANAQTITSFMHSNQRTDEQEADIAMTALNDFAQSPDDKMTMLTIAARMLNASDCPGSGEATARFLTIIVQHLKAEHTADDIRLLQFVRSRAFMDLASDDVTSVYFNDDAPDDSNYPITCGSTTTVAQRQPPRPATARAPLFTPGAGDQRNHATYWGERAAWSDARTQLFKELRDDGYAGWIHVATWESADACVDDAGELRKVMDPSTKRLKPVACTPIRVHYSSTPFHFTAEDATNLTQPFWLGRARFLRDTPPHVYEHTEDAALQVRGRLGRVIGVVDYGECVAPLSRPLYIRVTPPDEPRHFTHTWIKVQAAPDSACWPEENRVASASR